MWKETFRKIVKVFGITGKQQVKLATAIVNPTKNAEIRQGGFTPEQWVMGKSTRVPGSMIDEDEFGQLGVLENAVDPHSEFYLRNRIRYEARKCFVKLDCGKKMQTAMLKHATPLPGPYREGDLVRFKKEQGA